MSAARVTDVVNYFQRKGEPRGAVRVVQGRNPERFRWRAAVGGLTRSAGRLVGRDRMRIEEPVREVVVDLSDRGLQQAVVLEARVHGVDLDRGEVLPRHTLQDLLRVSFLTDTDLNLLQRHMPLPIDVFGPADTAAAVLVGSAFAEHHRQQARTLWAQLPEGHGARVPRSRSHRRLAARADAEAAHATRWQAFAHALLDS